MNLILYKIIPSILNSVGIISLPRWYPYPKCRKHKLRMKVYYGNGHTHYICPVCTEDMLF